MKTGDRLPNGATVMLEQDGIILAVQDSVEPFVTWKWDEKDPASTYHGHYYMHVGAAAYDFESRVEDKKKGMQRREG